MSQLKKKITEFSVKKRTWSFLKKPVGYPFIISNCCQIKY